MADDNELWRLPLPGDEPPPVSGDGEGGEAQAEGQPQAFSPPIPEIELSSPDSPLDVAVDEPTPLAPVMPDVDTLAMPSPVDMPPVDSPTPSRRTRRGRSRRAARRMAVPEARIEGEPPAAPEMPDAPPPMPAEGERPPREALDGMVVAAAEKSATMHELQAALLMAVVARMDELAVRLTAVERWLMRF